MDDVDWERETVTPVAHLTEMPRYFFHLFNDEITVDEEGSEHATLEAARSYAIQNARALAAHSVLNGHLVLDHRIEISDEQGARQSTVTFREAFMIVG